MYICVSYRNRMALFFLVPGIEGLGVDRSAHTDSRASCWESSAPRRLSSATVPESDSHRSTCRCLIQGVTFYLHKHWGFLKKVLLNIHITNSEHTSTGICCLYKTATEFISACPWCNQTGVMKDYGPSRSLNNRF